MRRAWAVGVPCNALPGGYGATRARHSAWLLGHPRYCCCSQRSHWREAKVPCVGPGLLSGPFPTFRPGGYAGVPGPDVPLSGGCGAVDRMSRYREAWTWYADASPGKQHVVMVVGAALVVMVLLAIVVVALVVFGVSPDEAL